MPPTSYINSRVIPSICFSQFGPSWQKGIGMHLLGCFQFALGLFAPIGVTLTVIRAWVLTDHWSFRAWPSQMKGILCPCRHVEYATSSERGQQPSTLKCPALHKHVMDSLMIYSGLPRAMFLSTKDRFLCRLSRFWNQDSCS